ncbi:hypothetical protein AGIG_G26789, partial [Arapaima gigas]
KDGKVVSLLRHAIPSTSPLPRVLLLAIVRLACGLLVLVTKDPILSVPSEKASVSVFWWQKTGSQNMN